MHICVSRFRFLITINYITYSLTRIRIKIIITPGTSGNLHYKMCTEHFSNTLLPSMSNWQNFTLSFQYQFRIFKLYLLVLIFPTQCNYFVNISSYGPLFSPLIYGPRTLRLGHISMGKNAGRNLQFDPITRLVRDMYFCHFSSNSSNSSSLLSTEENTLSK